jgi:putative sigma-54 modulation protein
VSQASIQAIDVSEGSTMRLRGSSIGVRQRSPDSSVGRARPRNKAAKRAGSTQAPQIPAYIRAAQGDLASSDRDYIRRKLGTKLGKFASSIERVSVRIEDVNGPRGGVDQLCRIKVVLRGLPSVVLESRDASLNAAVDGALSGVHRTVRRTLQRRRMKPLRRVD